MSSAMLIVHYTYYTPPAEDIYTTFLDPEEKRGAMLRLTTTLEAATVKLNALTLGTI